MDVQPLSVARHQTHEHGREALSVKSHKHFSIESRCHSLPFETLVAIPEPLYLASIAYFFDEHLPEIKRKRAK